VFRRRPKERQVHIGDATYDDWTVVRDFEDLKSAIAWRDHLRETGMNAVLTSDWELDRFDRGDIALRVEPADYGDAEVFLSGMEGD